MSYPIRFYESDRLYFITSRSIQGRMLMRPSETTNVLLGSILARGIRKFGVEVFDFVFLSNHFHLIVRAPRPTALARFMQFLRSNIAIKVGRFVNWRGKFWDRRYSAEAIVDDNAVIERMRYIRMHGLKEKLVSRCTDWPGLSALPELLKGEVRTFSWRNWTQRWFTERGSKRKLGRYDDSCPSQQEKLILTPPPSWQELSPEERQQRIAAMVQDVEAEHAAQHVPKSRRDEVLSQHPHRRPKHCRFSSRPKCHASTLDAWKRYVDKMRDFLVHYRQAAERWLRGEFDVLFPAGAFRPLYLREACEI